jgi:hypothetical protein
VRVLLVTSANDGNKPESSDKGKIFAKLLGIAVFLIVLFLIYYFLRDPPPTTKEILWADFLLFLPYLIVGGISLVFAFLDLYEKFKDFGATLPLTNKYGWAYMIFNSIVPMLLLYGYFNYFPSIGIPKIGAPDDVWLPSFVVALAFPLLIRSKFFTYTNASGDNVSVGFDQLYDRLVDFFVTEIQRSSKIFEKRYLVIKECAELFSLQELKNHAFFVVLNHEEWNEDRKTKEKEKYNKAESSVSDAEQKELALASYILSTNGEDYLRGIMLKKADEETDAAARKAKEDKIEKAVKDYQIQLGRSAKLVLSR